MKHYSLLRSLMPLVDRSRLKALAGIPLDPIDAIATACSKDNPRTTTAWLRMFYGAPRVRPRFAIAADDPLHIAPDDIRIPIRWSKTHFDRRQWLEEHFVVPGRRLLLTDDDPGQFIQGRYYPSMPTAMMPDLTRRCGARQRMLTPEEHCFLWRIACVLGEEVGAFTVGLNVAQRALPALPGYETFGPSPNKTYGTYGLLPLKLNAAIVNAAAILQPMRHRIPESIRGVRQEWLVASLQSIVEAMGHIGTLMFMPVRASYAVNPPPAGQVESDIETIKQHYPGMLHAGQTRGGRGCLATLNTSVQVAL